MPDYSRPSPSKPLLAEDEAVLKTQSMLSEGEAMGMRRSRRHSLSAELGHNQAILVRPMRSSPQPSGMVMACTFNLVLSSVGISALTLPWTTATLGWAQWSLCLMVTLFVSVYNLYLIDTTCRALPPDAQWSTYGGVVAAALGPGGAYALEMLMLVYSSGLLITNLGVAGTELHTVFMWAGFDHLNSHWWLQQNTFVYLMTVLIVLPLSLLPDTSMRWAGALGTACMIFVTSVVIGSAPWRAPPVFISPCGSSYEVHPGAIELEPVAWVSSLTGLLVSVPMLLFAINAATAFVSVRSQLTEKVEAMQPPRRDVVRMIWGGQLLAVLNYVACSSAGYLTFCGDTPANVLNAYPTSNVSSVAARLALALQLALGSAGVYVPLARLSLWHLFHGLEVDTPPTGILRSAMTVLLLACVSKVAVAAGGAMVLPLGLTSSICTTAIMFVFPGLCYIQTQRASAGLGKLCAPLLFTLLGLIVGVLSLTTLLMGAVQG